MIFISGCKTSLICTEITRNMIKPIIVREISVKYNRCRHKCVDIHTFKSYPLKHCGIDSMEYAMNTDLLECDGTSGFSNADYLTEVKPKLLRFTDMKRDYCKK